MNIEKERKAIERLRAFEPQDEAYYLCYSGGKDSDVILMLAELAGVKYEAVHNLTTVDAPETVKYVKSKKNVKISHPEKTMWELIVEKGMPPTRIARYCCATQKESGGAGRVKVTGTRWAESVNRKNSQGLITIIGKQKTAITKADELNADYQITKKGGIVLNLDNAETRKMVEFCYRTTSTLVNPIVDWTDDEVWE